MERGGDDMPRGKANNSLKEARRMAFPLPVGGLNAKLLGLLMVDDVDVVVVWSVIFKSMSKL